MPMFGSSDTKLVVLRGNSGCGKSSTALAIRDAHRGRLAWLEQDYVRHVLLRERDDAGGANVQLISLIARCALDDGYDVILEGTLKLGHYGDMLRSLHADHAGGTYFYYFDVSFEETVRRHATRPQAAEFGADQMRQWYRREDMLDEVHERIIPESASLAVTVSRILRDAWRE